MNVTAVILAGGKGKRFKPYTDFIPKPMFPVGLEERPLLDIIVTWLKSFNIRDYVFLVGYRWRYIYNYFKDGRAYSINIKYSLDDEKYSNTGGALLKAYKKGLITNETLLIWYGDIIAPVNVEDLLNRHLRDGVDSYLVVADRYRVPVGIAELDNNKRVIKMVEKPWLNLKATIGILTLNRKILEKDIEKVLGTEFDIMGDLIPYMIKEGYKVYGYEYTGEWYDIGSLERYSKLDHNHLDKIMKK